MFTTEHRNYAGKFLERLQQDLYAETVTMQTEFAHTGSYLPFEKHKDLAYRPISRGELWGKSWERAWFRLQGVIPESWAGKEVVLLLNLSGEVMLYDEKGNILAGLCAGTVYSPSYLKERYPVTPAAKGGEEIRFIAEAAANSLIGVVMDRDPGLKTPHPYGHYEGTVQKTELALLRREVRELQCDVEILLSAMNGLPQDDHRHKLLLNTIIKAAHIYSDNPENARSARESLQKILAFPAVSSALKVRALGHTHLDIGWLWQVKESTHKAARTFATQLHLMERYPDYIFGASQPAVYSAVKELYPEIYSRIKQAVKAGKWELLGGMWVEADVNLSGSESLVRQFLYGKNFFKDEFGVEVKNLWLPDAFGYSAALPQIIRKAGCNSFLSQKLSWNRHNRFPFHTFLWKGIDGSKVLTHFPPENNYCSTVHPQHYIAAANRFHESDVCGGFLSLFGFGDGGGGPDADHLERLKRLKNWEFAPEIIPGKAEDFFAEQQQFIPELPEYDGELYLELHRGTFTSQGRTKYLNRKCEQLICAVEMLSCQLPVCNERRKFFEKSWKIILLNQFHDILPGSAIGEVHRQTEAELSALLRDLREYAESVAEKIFIRDDDSLVLFNSLAHEFSGVVELPGCRNCSYVTGENGVPLPLQYDDGRVYTSITLAANSFTTLHKACAGQENLCRKSRELILENELIRYQFSAGGQLISAFDKEEQREVLSGNGNILSLYCDRPLNYQAWDIEPYYKEEKLFDLQMQEFKGKVSGKVFSQLEFSARFSNSTLCQKIRLADHSKRLDFITKVNWQEDFKLLRVAFPVDIVSREAVFDIQSGYLRRPATANNTIEMSAFETAGHRYADLSESNYGVALLNDCKYGYNVKNGTLDLALLRAPKFPDFDADRGDHEFTYSFCPHSGNTVNSDVMLQAAMLNREPLVFDGFSSSITPLCRVESDNGSIVLEAVKTAEKEDAYIIRISEAHGQHSKGILHFNSGNYHIAETDLMEWEHHGFSPVAPNGNFPVELRPFEIRTCKLKPGTSCAAKE